MVDKETVIFTTVCAIGLLGLSIGAWHLFTVIEPQRQAWCEQHGYRMASIGRRSVCVDSDRRVYLPE